MIKVPPGISGQAAQYNGNVDQTALANELALLNLGPFEPLNIHVNLNQYLHEIKQFDNDWVDYLPRTDRPNNRRALTLTNLPGKTHKDVPSLAEASYAAGRRLSELEFNQPTDVYKTCSSLHPFLDQWQPLGRTFIVQSNTGGYFVPHRDHPSMPRECFRLIVFLNNCGPLQYDWLMDDRKMYIQPGQVYYVNTRMTHRTISWVDNSQHLILNVPFTTENVARVIARLAHTH
jgi:hypothetical protein